LTLEDADYYRALSAKMLEQAQKARNEKTRQGFLELAASWRELGDKIAAVEKREKDVGWPTLRWPMTR
jgi:hypothetical protein